MTEDFKIFLKSIQPTGSGLKALAFCLLVVPFITDFLLMMLQVSGKKGSIYLSGMLINAYLKYLPFLILYLLFFFLVSYLYKSIFKK